MRTILYAILTCVALSTGCEGSDVAVDGLEVAPDTADKGETLTISGTVSSLAELTEVKIEVLDDKDAVPPESAGISVMANAYTKEKLSWDLRRDGDAKVVTTASTPSGTYKIRVEGKTEKKSGVDVKTFTVR